MSGKFLLWMSSLDQLRSTATSEIYLSYDTLYLRNVAVLPATST